MAHVLVVGGSGMLAETTLELVRRDHQVSLLARRPERLQGAKVFPLGLDYRETAQLRRRLEEAVRQRGPIELAVVWIHSNAPEAPFIVAEYVRGRYFHVLGSAGADPARPDAERYKRFTNFSQLNYHEVILGFVLEGGHSRWLRNAEISQGVLQAIDTDAKRFVVGTIEPWSARP